MLQPVGLRRIAMKVDGIAPPLSAPAVQCAGGSVRWRFSALAVSSGNPREICPVGARNAYPTG